MSETPFVGFTIRRLNTGAENSTDRIDARVAEVSRGLSDALLHFSEGDTDVPDVHTRFEPVAGFCFPASAACGFGRDDVSVNRVKDKLAGAMIVSPHHLLTMPDGVLTPDSKGIAQINEVLLRTVEEDIDGLVDMGAGMNKFQEPYLYGQVIGQEIGDGNPLIVLYGWNKPAQLDYSWGIVTGAHRGSQEESGWKLFKTSQGRQELVSSDVLAREIMGHTVPITGATVLSLRRSKAAS